MSQGIKQYISDLARKKNRLYDFRPDDLCEIAHKAVKKEFNCEYSLLEQSQSKYNLAVETAKKTMMEFIKHNLKEHAFKQYYPKIKKTAQKIIKFPTKANYDLEDLEHEGYMALEQSLPNYDENHGVNLWTYISYRVRGSMIDYIKKNSFSYTEHELRQIKNIKQAEDKLCKEYSRKPDDQEVANELGITCDKLNKLRELNIRKFECSEYSFEKCEDTDTINPEDEIYKQQLVKAFDECYQNLSQEEKLVLIGKWEGLTIMTIMVKANLSKKQVEYRTDKGVSKMKNCLNRKGYKDMDKEEKEESVRLLSKVIKLKLQ